MNNTRNLEIYNRDLIIHNIKIKNNRWSKFSYYIRNIIHKTRYKLLSLFVDLEESKEYDPGDLGIHNRKMLMDTWYKFAYYFKCAKCRLRYKFINFLVDVIVTMLVLIFLVLLSIVVGIITYLAMMVLIF